jgi:integrase
MATPKLVPGLKWREGTIHADFMWKGTRVRETFKTADPTLAEVMLGELKSALFRGTHVPTSKGSTAGRLSIARAFDLACASDWYVQARRNTRVAADDNFRLLTRDVLPASTAVQDLDKQRLAEIRRKLVDKGLSPGTVNLRMWVLRAALKAAEESGAIDALPPFPKAMSTEGRERQRYLTPEEEVLVLEYLSGEDRYFDLRDAWVVMLDTGMRVNEVATLTVRDVDMRQRTLKVPAERDKGKKGKVLPMTDRVSAIVERRARGAQEGRLFPPETDNPKYWVTKFGTLWREAREALGLEDVVCHTARHTVGTRLFEVNTDLRTAMAYMGHSTPSQTLKYAKVVAGRMHDVSAKMAALPGREGKPAETPAQEPHNAPEGQQ